MTNRTAERPDPLPCFCFLIDLNGPQAFFKSVSGLKSETEVVQIREGGTNDTTYNLVGATKWGPLVLKNGFTADSALVRWREDWLTGRKMVRQSGTITQLDTALRPMGRWTFHRGWPSKWEISEFDAAKSELSIETLEIVHEGLGYKQLGNSFRPAPAPAKPRPSATASVSGSVSISRGGVAASGSASVGAAASAARPASVPRPPSPAAIKPPPLSPEEVRAQVEDFEKAGAKPRGPRTPLTQEEMRSDIEAVERADRSNQAFGRPPTDDEAQSLGKARADSWEEEVESSDGGSRAPTAEEAASLGKARFPDVE